MSRQWASYTTGEESTRIYRSRRSTSSDVIQPDERQLGMREREVVGGCVVVGGRRSKIVSRTLEREKGWGGGGGGGELVVSTDLIDTWRRSRGETERDLV